MKLSLKSTIGAVALAAVLSAPAQAQLTATGLSCNNGNVMAFMGAVACSGAWSGNINNQQAGVNAALASFGGTWTFQGYSNDANNGPFTGNPDTVNDGILT